jgi:uncharacterized membrane protein
MVYVVTDCIHLLQLKAFCYNRKCETMHLTIHTLIEEVIILVVWVLVLMLSAVAAVAAVAVAAVAAFIAVAAAAAAAAVLLMVC